MLSAVGRFCGIQGNKEEQLKFVLLTFAFMLVIGAYTIAKELKDSVFVNIVGSDYLPKAKMMVILMLVPAALLYSVLVDSLRRYQLFALYCVIFGAISLVMGILLGHPTIGLANMHASPYRIFGWIFYFAFEGFSPYVVGVCWAFANSITSPEEAKGNYVTMVAGSKIGGMLTALFAWKLLQSLGSSWWCDFTGVQAHQILMYVIAGMLLCVPLVLYYMIKAVPGHYLHGYESVYQLEKQKSIEGKNSTGIWTGIKIMAQSPYILGIFGLVFFYETLNVILSFQRILILQGASSSLEHFTASMFEQRFYMHFSGFLISMLGVRYLVRYLGERKSLLMVPACIAVLLIYFMVTYSPESVLLVFIALGSINYSLSHPLRETLFIPATKDIKFKSKAWIDSFGTKFSKMFGSVFNDFSQKIAAPGTFVSNVIYSTFFVGLVSAWFMTAYLLGRTYEKAVNENEIIGEELTEQK